MPYFAAPRSKAVGRYWKSGELRTDADGRLRVKSDAVRRVLKISYAPLARWSRSCSYIGEPLDVERLPVPGRKGPGECWYLLDQIVRILEARRRADTVYTDDAGEDCLATKQVEKEYGFGRRLLREWEEECKYHSSGRLRHVMFPGPAGRGGGKRTYRRCDLDQIKANRSQEQTGIHQTRNGERLNLDVTSARYAISRGRLIRFFRKCRFLPEGKLPYEMSEIIRAGRGLPYERTILVRDMDRLRDGIAQAKRSARLPKNWKTRRELRKHYGVRGFENAFMGGILAEWLRDGKLERRAVEREIIGRTFRVWYYDTDQIDRLLADGGSSSVVPTSPAGEQPSNTETAAAPQLRRGRRTSPFTILVYRTVYEFRKNRAKDEKDTGIMNRVNKHFGRKVIQDPKHVWLYADRYMKYAKKNNIAL